MKLDVSTELNHPPEKVFEIYRDKLPELVSYLPNVKSIEVKERKENGDSIFLLNRWKGGGDIPAVAKSFISEKLLEWDDHATWDAKALTCKWKTVADALKDALTSEGENFFEALPNGKTRFRVVGEVKVDGKKVPGVPRLLSGAVGTAIETFLGATLKPNLLAVAKGVEKYLDTQK